MTELEASAPYRIIELYHTISSIKITCASMLWCGTNHTFSLDNLSRRHNERASIYLVWYHHTAYVTASPSNKPHPLLERHHVIRHIFGRHPNTVSIIIFLFTQHQQQPWIPPYHTIPHRSYSSLVSFLPTSALRDNHESLPYHNFVAHGVDDRRLYASSAIGCRSTNWLVRDRRR